MRSPTGEVIFHESEPVYQRRGVLSERIDQEIGQSWLAYAKAQTACI
jgi:hypothetical protein